MTGNPYAASSLLHLTKITQNSKAPYYYNPSRNMVFVTRNGTVLSGINFGDATVIVDANNVTIKDCTFTGTTSDWAVAQEGAFSGATVENCTFQGSKSPTEYDVPIVSTGAITIEGNSFLDLPTDTIDIHQGVVTGNFFSGQGYEPGAHADDIWADEFRPGPPPSPTISLMGRRTPARQASPTALFGLRTSSVIWMM